ncbi:MAG: tetratricopeptide repeat protein, partial [Planctomycetota bacterium]
MKSQPAVRTAAVTLIVIAAVFCLSVWFLYRQTPPAPQELLSQAQEALSREDYPSALQTASQVPADAAESTRAQLVVAESLIRMDRSEQAIEVLNSIPLDTSEESLVAVFTLAEVQRDTGHLSAALQSYQFVLQERPDSHLVHRRLAFLYGLSGQRWRSLPHLMHLVQTGTIELQELALLGDLGRPLEFRERLEQHCIANPHDPLVLLGLAAAAVAEGRTNEAQKLLDSCISVDSTLVAAHALQGELLVNGNRQTFTDWNKGLPAGADESPQIWLVRGFWLKSIGDLKAAARCFYEALRITPEHRRANYQLGVVLHTLNHPFAEEFSQRAAACSSLTRSLDDVLRSEGRNEPAVREVVRLLEQAGRYWEAWAWCGHARRMFPRSQWPGAFHAKVTTHLAAHPPRTAKDRNPVLTADLSSFPSYLSALSSESADVSMRTVQSSSCRIRFTEFNGPGFD